jgi:hypothetical protein
MRSTLPILDGIPTRDTNVVGRAFDESKYQMMRQIKASEILAPSVDEATKASVWQYIAAFASRRCSATTAAAASASRALARAAALSLLLVHSRASATTAVGSPFAEEPIPRATRQLIGTHRSILSA